MKAERLLLLLAFLGCVIGSEWVPGLAGPAFVIAILMWWWL